MGSTMSHSDDTPRNRPLERNRQQEQARLEKYLFDVVVEGLGLLARPICDKNLLLDLFFLTEPVLGFDDALLVCVEGRRHRVLANSEAAFDAVDWSQDRSLLKAARTQSSLLVDVGSSGQWRGFGEVGRAARFAYYVPLNPRHGRAALVLIYQRKPSRSEQTLRRICERFRALFDVAMVRVDQAERSSHTPIPAESRARKRTRRNTVFSEKTGPGIRDFENRTGKLPALLEQEVRVDPDILDLIPGYLTEVGALSAELGHCLEDTDFVDARVIGNNLCGNGGSYGFEALSLLGESIVMACVSQDMPALEEAAKSLRDYLATVRYSAQAPPSC